MISLTTTSTKMVTIKKSTWDFPRIRCSNCSGKVVHLQVQMFGQYFCVFPHFQSICQTFSDSDEEYMTPLSDWKMILKECTWNPKYKSWGIRWLKVFVEKTNTPSHQSFTLHERCKNKYKCQTTINPLSQKFRETNSCYWFIIISNLCT